MKKIKGARLTLKQIEVNDITDKVLSWFEDEELMKFYTNSRKKITKDDLLSSINEGKDKGTLFTFGIYHNTDSLLIGTIKIGPINFNHKTSDLVALIGDRNYLGKGFAVDAITLGNQMAFEEFDIRKLYGGMYISNIPSIKAYTKSGWLIEGRLKGQFLVEGKAEDRILVACFNPKYFSEEELNEIKKDENRYFQL
jgi:ribosomal-protein-alanine N-acetyltransferase